jgi:signal transduction histidine kinase
MQPAPNRDFLPLLRIVFLFLIIAPTIVFAEKLPLKFYSSRDGLASDSVNRIVPDSRGFLWFCTIEGLSRFDGFRFKNYTQEEGLPHRNINNFLETNDGDYLVATSGGLAVFNPLGKAFRWDFIDGKLEQNSDEPPMFKTYLTPDAEKDSKISKSIPTLAMDGNGIVYAGTNRGLFKFIRADGDWHFEEVEFEDWKSKSTIFNFLFLDSKKNLWIATNYAIYLLGNDGIIRKINESGGNSIFEDQGGKVWVDSGGNEIGIRIYFYQNDTLTPTLVNTYTKKDGLFKNSFSNAFAQTSEGRIFVSSDGKLLEFVSNAKENELKFRLLRSDGFSVSANKNSTLWFNTVGKGVARYSPNSFYIFGEKDGLTGELIKWVFGNKDGEVFLTLGSQKLARMKDEKIETVSFSNIKEKSWVGNFLDLQSQDGEFWISSTKGLFRFPKVSNFNDLAKTTPKIYTTADGLFDNSIASIFEDSRGDIWISSHISENSLLRWEKTTGEIYRYTFDNGLPKLSTAISFGEDAAGNIWIGFYYGQIVRYKDGKFRSFTDEGLIQPNTINYFLSDKQGRFWISTLSRGLFYVNDPNAETPVFTSFSTANGLSSNQTICLTEDRFGKIYVGTGRGINRLEPDLQRVKIYTQNDGLPENTIFRCYADVNGNLWFSATNSLIKFIPEADKPSAPPPIFINAISVNGKPQKISELGEKEINNLELDSDERRIQISFFAISFESGETLRYQYKLNDQDWNEPNERRTVDFELSPGTYNFSVRAVTASGVLSETLATVSFTIASPIWQRWWFISLSLLLISGIVFGFYRYRLTKLKEINFALQEAKKAEEKLSKARAERLAEIEQVRTRIATDLHDDIGSSLTQIAVLSEVARGQATHLQAENLSAPLERIKGVSKELVSVMSDIVWAINPTKDNLPDLIQRMRRFGSDVLSGQGIKFEFQTPEVEGNLSLGANIRREVFAIFKESINNSAKYSQCAHVKIDFQIEQEQLTLQIEDDGAGFDMDEILSENFRPEMGGNGLVNMRRRAKDLGGTCEIFSELNQGTKIILNIPLQHLENSQTG